MGCLRANVVVDKAIVVCSINRSTGKELVIVPADLTRDTVTVVAGKAKLVQVTVWVRRGPLLLR